MCICLSITGQLVHRFRSSFLVFVDAWEGYRLLNTIIRILDRTWWQLKIFFGAVFGGDKEMVTLISIFVLYVRKNLKCSFKTSNLICKSHTSTVRPWLYKLSSNCSSIIFFSFICVYIHWRRRRKQTLCE